MLRAYLPTSNPSPISSPNLSNSSGGSRGIGLASAIRLAKEGANIVITGKTAEVHSKLPGTIYSAAEDCKRAGAPDAIGIPVGNSGAMLQGRLLTW